MVTDFNKRTLKYFWWMVIVCHSHPKPTSKTSVKPFAKQRVVMPHVCTNSSCHALPNMLSDAEFRGPEACLATRRLPGTSQQMHLWGQALTHQVSIYSDRISGHSRVRVGSFSMLELFLKVAHLSQQNLLVLEKKSGERKNMVNYPVLNCSVAT